MATIFKIVKYDDESISEVQKIDTDDGIFKRPPVHHIPFHHLQLLAWRM